MAKMLPMGGKSHSGGLSNSTEKVEKTNRRKIRKTGRKKIGKTRSRKIRKTSRRKITKTSRRKIGKTSRRKIRKTSRRKIRKTSSRKSLLAGHDRGQTYGTTAPHCHPSPRVDPAESAEYRHCQESEILVITLVLLVGVRSVISISISITCRSQEYHKY